MRSVILAASLLLVGAAPPAATTSFNLVCAGAITTDSIDIKGKQEPYSYTYRIDLAKKKYCQGDCGAIKDIYDVQPASIRLDAPKDVDTIDDKTFADGFIDRQTGHQQILLEVGRDANVTISKWDGECVKQPFSGFTPITTKF